MRQIIGLACEAYAARSWLDGLHHFGYRTNHAALGAQGLPRVTAWILVFQPHERPIDYARWIDHLRVPTLLIAQQATNGGRFGNRLPQTTLVAEPAHAAQELPDLVQMLLHAAGPVTVFEPRGFFGRFRAH